MLRPAETRAFFCVILVDMGWSTVQMRTFEPQEAQRNLDTLLDALAEDGPFKIVADGKDIAVFVPVAMYEDHLARQRSGAASLADPAPKR